MGARNWFGRRVVRRHIDAKVAVFDVEKCGGNACARIESVTAAEFQGGHFYLGEADITTWG